MTRSVPRPLILCRTCANALLRDSGGERREPPRTCAAGIAAGAVFDDCESYVRQPLRPLPFGSRAHRDRA